MYKIEVKETTRFEGEPTWDITIHRDDWKPMTSQEFDTILESEPDLVKEGIDSSIKLFKNCVVISVFEMDTDNSVKIVKSHLPNQ